MSTHAPYPHRRLDLPRAAPPPARVAAPPPPPLPLSAAPAGTRPPPGRRWCNTGRGVWEGKGAALFVAAAAQRPPARRHRAPTSLPPSPFIRSGAPARLAGCVWCAAAVWRAHAHERVRGGRHLAGLRGVQALRVSALIFPGPDGVVCEAMEGVGARRAQLASPAGLDGPGGCFALAFAPATPQPHRWLEWGLGASAHGPQGAALHQLIGQAPPERPDTPQLGQGRSQGRDHAVAAPPGEGGGRCRLVRRPPPARRRRLCALATRATSPACCALAAGRR